MPVANGRPAHISAGRPSAFGRLSKDWPVLPVGPGADVAYGSYVVARILAFPRFLVGFGSGSIASPSLASRAFHSVFVFTPSAPAVQVFIPTMGAFDRCQLIVEFGHDHFASRWWECNGNQGSARPVFTHPPDVTIPWNHLRLRPDVDMADGN
jgi:hypothetical protein